jgi:hypothetical protein
MNAFIGIVAMALGVFIASSPVQAATIWGGKRFEELIPERRQVQLRWWRVLGIALGLAGILVAMDGG